MMPECTNREPLNYTISRLLAGMRHVVVGMSSPMPAAGAMLLRALNKKGGREDVQLSILGSIRDHASSMRHSCRGITAYDLGQL